MAIAPLPNRPGIGPSQRLPGVSKRQQLDEEMRKRGMLRKVRQIGERYPQVLEQVAWGRKKSDESGSGSGVGQPKSLGAPMSLQGSSVVDSALGQKFAPSRGGGGMRGGGGGGGVIAVGAGSPAAVGDSWRVSDEERRQADTYAAPFFGTPGDDQSVQAAIRGKLNDELDASANEQRAIQARIDNAGKASGGASPMVAAPGSVMAPEQQAAINKQKAAWEQKARLADDGTEEGKAKAARFLNEAMRLQATQQAPTPMAQAPVADIANRKSWSLDPSLQTAMLTNRPEILVGANQVLSPTDRALAAKYGGNVVGPTSYANLSGNLGPAPAPITPDSSGGDSGSAEDEAALSAAKAKKKAKKSKSSDGGGSSDSEG